jgi:hypothetical protein
MAILYLTMPVPTDLVCEVQMVHAVASQINTINCQGASMKVCVAGCSYSDYLPDNQVVYGELLARKLGAEYLHEGAGAGSNFRIWRRVIELIMDQTITANDLVIIQYTGIERREFWSATPVVSSTSRINTREPCDGGAIIRYKNWAHTWQLCPNDRQLFENYEQYHSNTVYSRQLFDVNHFQFQHTLRAMNIPTVFLLSRHTPDEHLDLITPHDALAYRPPVDWVNDPKTWYAPTDSSHLNDQAHAELAEQLADHVGRSLTLVVPVGTTLN